MDFDGIQPLLAEILAENACLSVKDLAVNGHDLMALGFQGREIGEMLDGLLAQVLEETLPNQREDLLTAAKKEK
jgi:tRNA nucleotidyltransferase (CCA-adding enzyme)